MDRKKKKKSPNSVLRLVFVGISLLMQIGWLVLLVIKLNAYSTWIYLFTNILAAIVVLRLYSYHTNSAYKTPWIMLILVLPIMGLCLYLLFELLGTPVTTKKRLRKVRETMDGKLRQDPQVLTELEEEDRSTANQCRYLWEQNGSPVYRNTQVTYQARAEEGFAALKEAVAKAEKFIFLEYFIVENGESFQELRQLLVKKAAEGVEVRLMYDDIGSIGYVNLKFARELNKEGIRCQVFNPAVPILNLFLNHRDHRKIAVIDGKVGFTGGYNLADEYFGLRKPYGHWKDIGIRLEGEAVRSLTAIFLELWNVNSLGEEDYDRYLTPVHSVPDAKGYAQPFGDDPTTEERVAENMYLNLISGAEKSVYIMTPYLIISDEMTRALGLAAKRGVDVRIITPGIPDKKTVFQITRSYYAGLARQGVRIYEYTPGFIHAKMCLCDGKIASIGTSNLDYRSLYLHFENNVLLRGCEAIAGMEADFQDTFGRCAEVTETYRSGRSAGLRVWQCVLRLFSPLV